MRTDEAAVVDVLHRAWHHSAVDPHRHVAFREETLNPDHVWIAVVLGTCCATILMFIVDMIRETKP